VVVADTRKFGGRAAIRVCGFAQIQHLVTDAEIDARFRAPLHESGVKVTVATSPRGQA
jgi:DeoR/GlpR family transcriptional regulator of sugar metabolism